jgi:outer membrane protein assembly factor BamB
MARVGIVLLLFAGLASPAGLRAENWPRWRGPDGNAVSSETPLPLRWGPHENVRWKSRVAGEGFSSPVVWGDRIFLTAAREHGGWRVVHCLDRGAGTIVWSREVEDLNPERASSMTGHAASTPATDGRHVVAFFGNAGVACYDFNGKRLWHRRLGEFDSELGLASSPVLYRDRVVLVCDHDGDRFTSFDSFLIALDLETGKDVWKTERRGLRRSWSTPVLVPGVQGKPEVVVSAQDHLRAYDPETGRQLWQAAGLTGWVAPSPVFGHGLIFATSGKDGPTLAVRPSGTGEVRPAWQHAKGGPYVCSPLLYGDYLYLNNEQGVLSCYQARTGQLQYRERLDGKFTGSPVAGDGKVYFTNEAGTTWVVKAGPTFAVLARNALGEYCLASPAIAGGSLFIRTEEHLFCVGPIPQN